MILNTGKAVLFALFSMISVNIFAQDLIARQAPIDHKLKDIDSLALHKHIP